MRFLSSPLLICALAAPALAQEPSAVAPAVGAAFTVEEAVQLAVRNNPRMTAAARDVTAARSGVRSAGALTNPTAVFAPGITSVSGSDEEFLLQQPLEVNGTRRARAGVASATLRGAEAQAVVTLRDVVFRVKTAYFGLARAREQAAIARLLLATVEEADRIARRQVELGTRPGIDLAQTGIEVSRAKRQVTLADSEAGAARAVLNTALGRKPSETVGALTPLSASFPAVAPTSGTDEEALDALIAQALAGRAEIQAEEAALTRFRQEARLVRAEGVPDLAPQLRVGNFTRGLQPANSGSGAGVALVVTLPLLDYGSRRNRIRQSEQEAEAQTARIATARDTVRQEVAEAFARLRGAEAIVRDYQGGVLDQAKRLLDGSRRGFQEGRVTVVALLEAQRSYIAVQTEYVNALAESALALAALERAVASPLPPGVTLVSAVRDSVRETGTRK